MDVSDPAHPQLSRFLTGRGRPAGPWGRGGPVAGPQGVYVQTADGNRDPGGGIYGNAVLAVQPKAYGLAGMRLGYCVGHADLITAFDKVRNHFGITRMGQAAGVAALADQEHLRSVIAKVRAARDEIGRKLFLDLVADVGH